MRSRTLKIEVAIGADDALSIINALNKGLDINNNFDDNPKEYGARDLLELLNCNFTSSMAGVHHLKKPR